MFSIVQRTLHGGVGYVAAAAIQAGSGTLLLIVAGRQLGAEGVGLLVLGMAVAGFVRNAAEWGLPITAQRYMSGANRSECAAIFGMLLVLGTLTALGAAFLLFAIAGPLSVGVFDEPALAPLVRIFCLSVALTTWVRLLRGALQARERIRDVLTLDTITHVGRLLVLVIVLWFFPTPTAAAWALALSLLPALASGARIVGRAGIRADLQLRGPLAARLLRHATPVSLAAFSYLMARHADKFMLGALSTAAVVGVYGVAASLAEVTRVLSGAFTNAFMPLASDAYRRESMGEIRTSYRFINKWVAVTNGIVLIALAAVGPWLLAVFGSEFAVPEAFVILMILAASSYANAALGPTGALLQMANGQKIEFVNTILYIATNIGLNFLLIPPYGGVGAAVATAASAIGRNLLQGIEIRNMYGFHPVGRVHVAIVTVVAVAVAAILVVATWPGLILAVTVGTALGLYAIRTFPRDQMSALRARITRRRRPPDLASTASKP